MVNMIAIAIVVLVVARFIWFAVRAATKTSRSSKRNGAGQSEGEFFATLDATPFAEMRISYVDAGGKTTQRDIAVYKIDLRSGLIEAYCRLRRERRSFYADGMRNVIDLSTGELVDDVKAHLRAARGAATRKTTRAD